ncbi:MAG: hypothetical protein GY910_09320 [bacterium]|nr:hypothetical protein [bacterium]
MKSLALAAAAALVLSSLGCAFGELRLGDPFDREYTLEQAQHRYTTLVRFSDFDRARDFVAEEKRGEFMTHMRALDDARFTDYESGEIELDANKTTATILVTYTIYTPSMPYAFEVAETQVWSRGGLSNDWRVRSTFEGLQKLALN